MQSSLLDRFLKKINWKDYLPIFTLIGFNFVLYRYLTFFLNNRIIRYTRAAYFEPSILLASVKNWIFLSSLILLLSGLLINYSELQWKNFNHSFWLKIILVVLSATIAWRLSTYPYDFIYNHWHAFERLSLLISVGLIVLHPAFAACFLVIFLVLQGGFNHHVSAFPHLHQHLQISILVLFVAHLYNRIIFKAKTWTFLFVMLCLTAASYFGNGLQKIAISPHGYEWPLQFDAYLTFATALFRGWLQTAPAEIKNFLMYSIKIFNRPIVIFVFLIELAALFLVVRKRLSIFLLAGFITLHTGIFLISGFFFWPWIVADALILLFLLYGPRNLMEQLFRTDLVCLSILIIFTGPLIGFFHSHNLGWWDVRYHFRLDIVGIKTNGNRIDLNPTVFRPYHIFFQTGYSSGLPFVSEKIFLMGPKTYSTAVMINNQVNNKGSLQKLKNDKGTSYFNPRQATNLNIMLKLYLERLLSYETRPGAWLNLVNPPRVIQLFDYLHASKKLLPYKKVLKRIDVVFVEGFYNGERNIVLDRKRVLSYSL